MAKRVENQKESSLPSVLFINRVYPPQEGATGQLLAELASHLLQRGWSVTIICSGKPLPSDADGSIRVIRVGGLAFNRASHLKRAVSYLSLYPKFLMAAMRSPRHDLVVTLTDPPLHLFLGPMIKWVKKSRLVHWAQDIYPEIAEELGVLGKRGLGAGVLRFVSEWSLRRYDAVIAVGRCMKERLLKRGIPESKLHVIPNWSLDSAHGGDSKAEILEFRKQNNLEGKFVVMYSGNFGLAHPFEAIVGAARELEMEREIQFVFLGGGPRYKWVEERCQGQVNVTFLPYQPRETLNASLGSADIHLACMEESLEGLVVPSKIYGILAAGRPCLFLGPFRSEAAMLVKELDAGWVLDEAQFPRLVATIRQAASDPSLLKKMGSQAESYSRSHGSMEAGKKFLQLFSELTLAHRG